MNGRGLAWFALALVLAPAQVVAQEDAQAEEVDEVEEEAEDVQEFQVDTVLVSAEELARVGGAAQRLDEEDLEALEYDDPNSVLQQVPAVYVRREDGFGLRPNIGIRGANSERSKKITLMEDGILFAPAPYSAPAAYYFPIASRMVGLEVFKGPSAIKYGPHTVGGAVNWVTRPIPWDESAGVDLNFGRFMTGKLHSYYGKSWDQFGFLLEGVQWQSDGYKELDGGGDTGFNKSELMAKLRVNSDLAASVFHAVRVKLGYSREVSDETYLGVTDEDFARNPDRRYAASALDRMEWGRTQAELRYRMEVGNAFDVSLVGYRHDFHRAWRKLNAFADPTVPLADVLSSPTGRRRVFYDILRGEADSSTPEENLLTGTNDRTFVSQGVDLGANFRSGGESVKNEVHFGARVHYDSILRLHTEEDFVMTAGQLEDLESEPIITTNNFASTVAYAGFVQDELQFWRIALTPGLRVEVIDGELENLENGEVRESQQTAVLPGVGAYFEIADGMGVLGGVHRGFSPVSPGQPDEVAPEISTNYEVGARFLRAESKTLVELVGFFNDYRNLLGECTFSAGCNEAQVDDQFNAGRVWVYGLEAVAAHRFALGNGYFVPGRVSYTLTESQFLTGFASDNPQFGDVEVGDELPYVPEHQLSARLGLEKSRVTWNLGATYVSPMREEAGQGEDDLRTDPQIMLDVLGSYELVGGLSVYVKVDNLLNERPIVSRRPYGARPARPLLFQAGLRWDLEKTRESSAE